MSVHATRPFRGTVDKKRRSEVVTSEVFVESIFQKGERISNAVEGFIENIEEDAYMKAQN